MKTRDRMRYHLQYRELVREFQKSLRYFDYVFHTSDKRLFYRIKKSEYTKEREMDLLQLCESYGYSFKYVGNDLRPVMPPLGEDYNSDTQLFIPEKESHNDTWMSFKSIKHIVEWYVSSNVHKIYLIRAGARYFDVSNDFKNIVSVLA